MEMFLDVVGDMGDIVLLGSDVIGLPEFLFLKWAINAYKLTDNLAVITSFSCLCCLLISCIIC